MSTVHIAGHQQYTESGHTGVDFLGRETVEYSDLFGPNLIYAARPRPGNHEDNGNHYGWWKEYHHGNGHTCQPDPTPVPEPMSTIYLGTGLAIFIAVGLFHAIKRRLNKMLAPKIDDAEIPRHAKLIEVPASSVKFLDGIASLEDLVIYPDAPKRG